MVFKLPLVLAGGISKSNSAILRVQCSDFTTSLFKSYQEEVNSSSINYSYFRLDASQDNILTLILELSGRLELVVFITTFFTFESDDDNL